MASELGVQTIQHTNGTDALTIGSDGVVTRPSVPRYFAWRNSTENVASSAAIDGWRTAEFSQDVTEASGVFTISKAGLYTVSYHLIGDVLGGVYLYVNSTRQGRTSFAELGSTSAWADHSASFIWEFSASDSFYLAPESTMNIYGAGTDHTVGFISVVQIG
jgi:hypothetical protein